MDAKDRLLLFLGIMYIHQRESGVSVRDVFHIVEDVWAGRGTDASYSDAMCDLHIHLNEFVREMQSRPTRTNNGG